MMRRNVVFTCRVLMTGSTNLVALMLQSSGVGIMAIGTANALGVHLALQKRTIDINFILNLPVSVIQTFPQ